MKPPFDDPREAWKPYEPSAAAPWDDARAAHLHRRAGFGATWAQVRRDVGEGLEPSLRRVLDGEAATPDGRTAAEFERTVDTMEQSFRRRPSMGRVSLLWAYRLVFSPHPLAEVMTLAWHSHYAASQAKVRSPEAMWGQNRLFRDHWRDRASVLHSAILADPAMLAWLDGFGADRGEPNENLGREFLELFALGTGEYGEADVRETARALTGWRRGSMTYQPMTAVRVEEARDRGPKSILGETGDWTNDDVARIALRRPAAAEHLARRLFRTFIADASPPRELIAGLADEMRVEGDVDLARGIETILRSRLFHSEACRARMVRSPASLVVGAIRACEASLPPIDLEEVEGLMARMGQRLFYPPSVSGWPGGVAWLDDSAVLARANFAAWFAGSSSGLPASHFRELAERNGWRGPAASLDALQALLLAVPVGPEARRRLLVEDDPAALVRSLLSSPEGQLA